MNDEPCLFLDWDSDFFGYRIGHVNSNRLSAEMVEDIITWCRLRSIECLYFLADSDDPATVRLAEAHGFRLVEVRLILECWPKNLDNKIMRTTAKDVIIRRANVDDILDLQNLSQNGYIDSRFYVDEHFPRERCQAFYGTWIRKSVETELVFVAEIANKVQGYLVCHQETPESDQIRLDLVAVQQEARRTGIGQALFKSLFEWCERERIEYIWSATQGRNIAAQCLFQRMGFLPRSCHLYYHKWF